MSVARHHAEWLSLVETSGPFLSMPVLQRVFPQGLDKRDTSKASQLREAYEDWQERGERHPAVHHAWIRHVLTEFLEHPPEFLAEGQAIPPGMEAVMANYGETLRPGWALKHRDSSHKPLLLIEHYSPDQDLEKPVAGKLWKASPDTRMMELLHATEVPLGLITNGEQWMLVYAPRGETTGFASWYADLWMQEPITLQAFQSLLHLRRFLGVAEPETLAALYQESSKDQQEVTDQLGYQVRQAVEMLVQAFDRIDAESDRKLLAEVSEKSLYDSALTVMMRLVFLFSADERGLLLLGDPLYDQHYAVSTLSELLRERADQHGEEVLERRHDAWCRLLATFRAVHAGVEHEAMRLPPYGGTLFDPDRYPFLEGRAAGTHWKTTAAKPLPINNRVVLHLLEALQVLRVKVPGGGPAEARRLSFRALDIEQIGHVYEGLLDHTAKRAGETILGLTGSKNSEPEIPLTKLEELAAKGINPLVEFLAEETGRSESTLRRALDTNGETKPAGRGRKAATAQVDDHQLLIACNQDPRLVNRVKPFASLLRRDSFDKLVVIPEDSVYVTAGTDRRSTGTHYTPRSLTEPIVQHTLEPLVYIGPAEGVPQAEWKLKPAREILSLKVCDMTMGSGAFLVQTCRYLAERLVEAWEQAEKAHPGCFVVTPEGELSKGSPGELLLPKDPAERIVIARRFVADRCLYGVDINPMAVEMAKLSLWLITLQRDRPFTFLDHALKCGDSLLGVGSVKQIENFSLRPGEQQVTLATLNLFRYVEEASAKRHALEDLPSNDHSQIETKTRLHAEAEAAIAKVNAVADCLIALELQGLDGDRYEEARNLEAEKVQWLMKQDADTALTSGISNRSSALLAHAHKQLRDRHTFHWPVEFPEVFVRGGFDAFVGNPPFMGGEKLETSFGTQWRAFLVEHIADGVTGVRGGADLCTYFLLRATQLVRHPGVTAFIATNSIAQGDSRTVGLDRLLSDGACVYRAVSDAPWPGAATVHYAALWIHHGAWRSHAVLDSQPTTFISAMLRGGIDSAGPPRLLGANMGKAFKGSMILGVGFLITPQEASVLQERNVRNRDVTYPYLTGEDLNGRPDMSPSRWTIWFRDWPLSKAETYPDCLDIVRQKVKPSRDAMIGKNPISTQRGKNWWRFGGDAKFLYERISGMDRVLAMSRITNHLSVAFVPSDIVFADRLTVFPFTAHHEWCVLQSTLHYCWAWTYSTTNLSLLSYSPSQSFDTFPFPLLQSNSLSTLDAVGRRYDQERSQVLLRRGEGLTTLYNHFHDRGEESEEIARLRALHVEMDQAVAAAYGWSDLDLGHGFHETKQGVRFTISEPARRTVLDRLLALNHQRYAEEVAAGLHDKKKRSAKRSKGQTRTVPTDPASLFEKPR